MSKPEPVPPTVWEDPREFPAAPTANRPFVWTRNVRLTDGKRFEPFAVVIRWAKPESGAGRYSFAFANGVERRVEFRDRPDFDDYDDLLNWLVAVVAGSPEFFLAYFNSPKGTPYGPTQPAGHGAPRRPAPPVKSRRPAGQDRPDPDPEA